MLRIHKIRNPIFILFILLSAHQKIDARINHKIPLAHPESIVVVNLYAGGKLVTIKGSGYIQINQKLYSDIKRAENFTHTPDGSVYGFSYESTEYKDGHNYYYQIMDKKYGPYHADAPHSLQISKDGSTFAFVYKMGDYGRFHYYVQTTPKKYGPYFWASETVMNQDGSMVAFKYVKETYINWIKNHVYIPLVNSREAVDCILESIVPAYVSRENPVCEWDGRDYSRYIQINGKTLGPFQGYVSYVSLKKRRFAFTYEQSSHKVNVRIDEQIFGPYDWATPPVFSEDGKDFAFFYANKTQKEENSGNGYIRHNQQILGPFKLDNIFSMGDIFSEDLSQYAIVTLRNATDDVIKYKKGKGYTLNAKKQKEGYYFRKDKKEYGPYDQIEDPVLSKDGSRFAFFGRHYLSAYDYHVNIDGNETGHYLNYCYYERTLKFSPDGTHIGYNTCSTESYAPDGVVIDGKKYKAKAFDFTPDGKPIIAYVKEAMLIIEEL